MVHVESDLPWRPYEVERHHPQQRVPQLVVVAVEPFLWPVECQLAFYARVLVRVDVSSCVSWT